MSRAALHWHVYAAPEQVASAVVDDIRQQARLALEARGAYRIVLAGGGTPRPIYAALAQTAADWARWHVYFSDERCLPSGHPGRNDTMARAAWLDRVPIPPEQIHPIPAELGARAAAAAYGRILASVGPFDTTLLGLGEDAHTASLFPGEPTGSDPDAPDVLAVHGAPKPPAERVSLSARRLAAAKRVGLIVTGSGKRSAVKQLHDGADVPIAAIVPQYGIDVWLDAAAAADLGADVCAHNVGST